MAGHCAGWDGGHPCCACGNADPQRLDCAVGESYTFAAVEWERRIAAALARVEARLPAVSTTAELPGS